MENNTPTIEDFREMMDLLQVKREESYQYIFYTGQQGYDHFSLAMCGMYMPNGVPYSYVNFKRRGDLFYLSVGKKHGNLKVLINTTNKSYRIFNGTKEIFVTYDNEVLTKQIKIEYEKTT